MKLGIHILIDITCDNIEILKNENILCKWNKKTLDNHFNGIENNEHKIWSILQFNQWFAHYIEWLVKT